MAGDGDWRTAHAALSRLARQRVAADAEEGRWLLTAQRLRAHVHLGLGDFFEYVERLFGYRPRTTHEMACCDGQLFALETESESAQPREPERAHVDVAQPPDSTNVHVDATQPAQSREPAQPRELAQRQRAKQSIPPALRRAVLHRNERRCQVPGCSNGTFLDLHHLQPRSEGGAHTAGNLLTVCTAHHRALHRGTLKIERGADGTLSSPGSVAAQGAAAAYAPWSATFGKLTMRCSSHGPTPRGARVAYVFGMPH